MSVGHYENFPVASILLPRRLREPVRLLYRFAREADDIADEGDRTAAERLTALNERALELDRIATGDTPRSPLYQALAQSIHQYQLPVDPFRHLLSAFTQDVTTTRYATFDDVLSYCTHSANPVGRLMLRLFGVTDARAVKRSDDICSSLQLINFLQDIAIDFAKGRIYLPQDELARFGVEEAHIAQHKVTPGWRNLMRFQIDRARSMLLSGAPLGRSLGGRIGLELRMIVAGGARILAKLEAVDGDVFTRRPTLSALDWLRMGAHALTMR